MYIQAHNEWTQMNGLGGFPRLLMDLIHIKATVSMVTTYIVASCTGHHHLMGKRFWDTAIGQCLLYSLFRISHLMWMDVTGLLDS